MSNLNNILTEIRDLESKLHEDDFLLTWEHSPEELKQILLVAEALRTLRNENVSTRVFDSGLGVSLFRDNSTRTRFSYASACNMLDLAVQDLDEGKSQIAHGETTRETANMISFCADVIGIRDDMYLGHGNKYMREVADALDFGKDKEVLAQRPALVNLQCDIDHQLDVYKKWAAEQAVVDYSFHGTIQHINDHILDEMESMVEAGISSFKLYLTYGYKLSDADVLRALLRLNELNALTCVHPENDSAIQFLRDRMLASGQTDPVFHALSRPAECEAEAIARMINLAAMADAAPLYIVHLSNSPGLDYIRLAQAQGQPVYAETCPQYLFLDMQRYHEQLPGELPEEGGLKYILSPPLRESWHQDRLWDGLNDGSIDTVATDHCTFTLEQKRRGLGDFTKCPNGLPGVETRLPLLFSEGVMKGRMSINRFVELVSTAPAKLFGLYPQKGVIREGADADLVIIDPSVNTTIHAGMQHSRSDYTPYEGFELLGYPVLTMLRGSTLVEGEQFFGRAGQGRFIKRKPLDEGFRLR